VPGALGPPPTRPGVRVPSPREIVPAVMVLLAASETVAPAPAPCPTANSFPPPAGIAPEPVLKLKLLNAHMASVTIPGKVLLLHFPIPARKLAFLDPPLTLSEPAPAIVSEVVIAPSALGVPTTNT